MVTVKRREGAAAEPFSAIAADGRIVASAITEAFLRVIEAFHETWYCIEPIRYFVIMPDHLHLIIKILEIEKRVSLAVVVRQLIKALDRAYWAVAGAERLLQNPAERLLQNPAGGLLQKLAGGLLQNPAGGLRQNPAGCDAERLRQNPAGCDAERLLQNPAGGGPGVVLHDSLRESIFAFDWHDWIVKKSGQLAAFRKYIAENGPRAARRRAARQFFTRAREIAFQGRRYWAYGNEALLELPVIVAIKGHRRPLAGPVAPYVQPQDQLRGSESLCAAASRIGPGGAGLSTFLSPLEREAGNEIIKAGGALIILSMEGFAPRWHPSEKQERLCAAGRMLYLSPYEPRAAKLTRQEMHVRAHELVDWALAHSHERLEAWP